MAHPTIIYSHFELDKSPMWLSMLDKELFYRTISNDMTGTHEDYEYLKRFVDNQIEEFVARGVAIRSVITTEVRSDNGRASLWIKRNGKLVVIYRWGDNQYGRD